MKTFLKYFLILGLSYSCAAMTPGQQSKEQQNQEKLSQLLEIVQKQQEDKKQQEEMSKQPKASSSLSYSKARKVVAGLLVAAGVAGLAIQNADLQRQISAIVTNRAERDAWEGVKWSMKFVVCLLGGNPLAALFFV